MICFMDISLNSAVSIKESSIRTIQAIHPGWQIVIIIYEVNFSFYDCTTSTHYRRNKQYKHPSTDHCIVSSSISQLGSRPSCSCTLWNIYLFTMGSKTKISLSIIFISYEIQGDLINSGWSWSRSISFNLQGRAVVSKCGWMGRRCRLNSDIWSNDYFVHQKDVVVILSH